MLYDIDPVITATSERLAKARDIGYLVANPEHYRSEIITLLNYFDAVAIGIDRDLYDYGIVTDHLKPIILKGCETYMKREFFEGHVTGADIEEDFPKLVALIAKWRGEPT